MAEEQQEKKKYAYKVIESEHPIKATAIMEFERKLNIFCMDKEVEDVEFSVSTISNSFICSALVCYEIGM